MAPIMHKAPVQVNNPAGQVTAIPRFHGGI